MGLDPFLFWVQAKSGPYNIYIYIYISQRFQGVSFGVYNIWFFGFFMLYAILENSLRICLVLLLRNKSETIVKGIVTNFEGFKLFCLNYN